jgi:DNA-directed RNA polymerase specialized sigma24 family protein
VDFWVIITPGVISMNYLSKTNLFKRQLDEETLLFLIKKVVERYVRQKIIPQREFEDVMMTVVEKVYSRKEKIENAFEGRSTLTTYYIAVINRVCCEVIRKEKQVWQTVEDVESMSTGNTEQTEHYETEKKLIVTQEVKRLEYLLLLLNHDKEKVILFLKFYFDIPVDFSDVTGYAKDRSKEVFLLLTSTKPQSREDTFTCLADVVNKVENKHIGKDAVRIWFTSQLNSLIERLNGNDPGCCHNRESLSILMEMLYRKENHVLHQEKPRDERSSVKIKE